MKSFIKRSVLFLYKYIYLRYIKGWIVNNELQTAKSRFNKTGDSFFLESPFKILNPQYIIVGNGFWASINFRIEAIDEYYEQTFFPAIVIGDNVSFGSDCHVGCINNITIGNNVMMGSKVFISDHSHGQTTADDLTIAPIKRHLYSKGPVVIEDNVWIGEGVSILPGVIIGKNSIVGANSVITKSFPANSVIGGNPGKIIKEINIG